MKILCTGNPSKFSIAKLVKEKWNHACCISPSSGWDLKLYNDQNQDKFKNLIQNYNVFINSSYIATGQQARLLSLVCATWMEADIKGHIITIGTTAEWSVDSSSYVQDKQELRKLSLELNDKTGITGVKTTYIILGGLDDGHPKNSDFVCPESVVNAIEWVLNFPDQMALLQIEKAKASIFNN
jgi:hypothetical protein